MKLWRAVCLAFATLPALLPHAAGAQTFYRGKTVTILVSTTAGGGFDTVARLLARHLGAHIPGAPTIIVQNMPGAGGATAVRYLDSGAAKDGTVMTIFNVGLIGDSLLTPQRTPVDFRNYAWIGSAAENLAVCYVWHGVGPKTIAEMRAHGRLNYGSTGAGGGAAYMNIMILKNIFGIDIHLVSGYPGSAEYYLAIERGELDGGCDSWSSIPEPWIAGDKIVPIYRAGTSQPSDMKPGVPILDEIAPDARARAIVHLLNASNELGRPFVASRAVPPDRIALLRRAFDQAVREPGFAAEAAKARLPVSPRTGEQALKIVEEIYATPPDIVAAARKVIGE
jgi:tripartite-type tricarboxylate transporter receptor subunit TctC